MSDTVDALSPLRAPDMSSLTKRQQLNIAVAVAQGWHWERDTEDKEVETWVLLSDTEPASMVWFSRFGIIDTALPDYAGDPAAWGALMEWELDGHESHESSRPDAERGRWWRCWYNTEAETYVYAPWCLSLGVSVCAAVLAKAGIDPTPYIGD